MRYLVIIIALFAALQTNAQNNIVYGAGINYTNGAPTFTPPVRTSRVAIDTVTGKWYHFNTPGGWQLIGNTIEEIAGCTAPAYTPGKGDSKVVINNCSPQPELYFYNGSAWVLVGGGSVYAGEGIRIENDTIILDSLNFLDFRTGNALDGDVGRVQWNDTDGTLDLNLKGGNVTLQIGQEEVSLVKHADNSGLIEGRVVYIVGSDGTNKTVRYALADSDLTSATTFGLMTESASGGGKAFCTTFGLVRDLNTTNLTEGGIVWLSADTAGTMTAVRPTAPDHGVMIGFCVRKHATQGAIFVQVQNGYELNELHDVFVPSPTNGQVLTWNSTNARWEAITPANQLQTLSTDNTPGNISISSGNTITLNVNDADADATNELQTLSLSGSDLSISGGNTVTLPAGGITGTGANTQVAYFTGTTTQASDDGLVYNASTNVLGINMGATAPSGSNLIIKNSQEPARTTVVTAQTFSADTTNWTRGAGWAFNGTQAVATLASGALTYTPALTITNGNWYEVAYTMTGYSTGTLNVSVGNSSVTLPSVNISNNVVVLKPTAATGGFRFTTSAFTGNIDNVTVVQIATPAPVLLAGQDDNSTTLYNSLVSPSSGSFGFGGGLRYSTAANNYSLGNNALRDLTSGLSNIGIGNNAVAATTSGNNNIGIGNSALFRNLSGSSNVGIGTSALENNTIGVSNTAVGLGALSANTSGGSNSGFGNNALNANTTGVNNTAIGAISLTNSRTGSNNVGIGSRALQFNITGGDNMAMGFESLQNNTGSGNVGLGTRVLREKRAGNYNTAIGTEAGLNSVVADSLTGANNTLIGYQAATNIAGTASGNLVLGNQISLPVNNANNQINIKNIIFGTGASGTGTTIAGNIGIGLTNPAARLHVVGSGTSSSTWTAQFHNSATGGNNALMIRDDGRVAMGTNAPNASAILTVTSTTGGILFPRMTTTERNAIATPADGLVIYNTTDNKLQVRAAGAWVDLH